MDLIFYGLVSGGPVSKCVLLLGFCIVIQLISLLAYEQYNQYTEVKLMVSYLIMENLFQRCSFENQHSFFLRNIVIYEVYKADNDTVGQCHWTVCALRRLSPGSIYFVEGERGIEFFLKLLADSDVDKVYILNSVSSTLPSFLCIIYLGSWQYFVDTSAISLPTLLNQLVFNISFKSQAASESVICDCQKYRYFWNYFPDTIIHLLKVGHPAPILFNQMTQGIVTSKQVHFKGTFRAKILEIQGQKYQ